MTTVSLVRPILAVACAATIIAAVPVGAASDKTLRAVRGTSGYVSAPGATFKRIFGQFTIADDAFAVTQAASNALLVLPDSSEVALGANTNVQVGAFNDPTQTTPTTLTLQNGALRFDVRHPAGAQSNYHFQTTTSQIAVRGTIGLYQTGPNGDVISCLQCSPGDVEVTVKGRKYALLTGETLFVTVGGAAVTPSNGPAPVSQAFAGTGLTTEATAQTAFTASFGTTAAATGAAGAAAAPAAATSIIVPIAGAAAIGAGIAAGTSSASHGSTTVPSGQPTPTPIVTPTPAPIVTPTPSNGTGSATLNGVQRGPANTTGGHAPR